MIRNLRMTLVFDGVACPPKVIHGRPMENARSIPDSVRELARSRPPIPLPRPASPWPLTNSDGLPWHEVKRRKEEQA